MIANVQRIGVGYLRISDPRLDSLGSQRDEIAAYAKAQNIKIIDWYEDEQPGWQENRDDFQRLLHDAESGKFEVVVARALDRFSRLPVKKLFSYLDRLEGYGVTLETVDDGPIDADDDDDCGWLMAGVKGHAKRKYVSDLGRNTTSGKLKLARMGRWAAGPVAYGYRYESFGERQGGKLILGPEIEQEAVRFIFEQYTTRAVSLVELCDLLTARGYPPPRATGWTTTGLRVILKRPHYIGKAPQLTQNRGKFYTAGRDCPVKNGNAAMKWKPQEEWFYVDCPPIIDQDVWDLAQRMLVERRTHTQPKTGDGKSLFGGILFCGDCGAPMWAENKKIHGGGWERIYCCSLYMEKGPKHCHRNPVKESFLIEQVLPAIRDQALSPANVEEVRKALARRIEKRAGRRSPAALKEARKRLDEFDEEIRLAVRELRRVPDDLHDAVAEELRGLRAERADMEARVKALEIALNAPKEDTAKMVAQRMARLDSLREQLASPDKAVVRLAICACVERVDCFHDHTAYATAGKRPITKHKLRRVVIRLVGGLYVPGAPVLPT